MTNAVETSTPANTPKPIGPYSHIAKVGAFITIGGTGGVDPATGHRPARTVIAVSELPKPAFLLTMNLTAVASRS
jgi:2-iminobutanoate/2-iminopropanoate deaminase